MILLDFGMDQFSFSSLTFSALLCILFFSRLLKLYNGLKAVNHLPGLRVPFQALAFPGALFPTSWWNPGMDFPWVRRCELYETYRSESVSVIPFISGVPVIYTSNLDVVRQIVAGGHKSSFVKPVSATQTLLFWGMNLIGSDGETWRRHRRIMGPAFNNETYRMVWEKTAETYHDMIIHEGWAEREVVEVPVTQNVTFKLALLVLASCGFGFPFNWSAPPTSENGEMSVQAALRVVAEENQLMITLPRWVWKLPIERYQNLGKACSVTGEFMRRKVAEKKAEMKKLMVDRELEGGKYGMDVFSTLVKANEMEGKLKLNDEELIGNVFGLLIAGHETTAYVLAAALGLLAIHTEIQVEVREHILAVVGNDREPTFEDCGRLDKVLAVFYESIRMFPPGSVLIREATEDTVLTIPNPVGQEGSTTMPIPKGVQIVADMVGVEYNPRYFAEPKKFKPSRWYGSSSDDTFTGFSVGPRACIGRKFSTTEAVCFLSLLLREWEVEPLLAPGESREHWAERVLEAKMVLTLAISSVPVKFVRR